MSYIDPGAGESFVFRVQQSIITQPSRKWFNTYEARFFGGPATEALDSLAEGLALYTRELLLNIYQVDSVTISTWSEDSHPYNPASFVTQPKGYAGARPIGIGTPADLRTVLYVKRIVESGRIGRIFHRGVLLIGDLTSASGEWALTAPSTIVELHDDALAAGELAAFFITGEQTLKLCLIGEGQVTREYENMVVGGTTQVKLNHKYFDVA